MSKTYKVWLKMGIKEYSGPDKYIQDAIVEENILVGTFTHRNEAIAYVKSLASKFKKPQHKRRSIADRFWAKVDRTTHESGCWIWLAYRDKQGHGRLALPGTPPRTIYAHKFSWELHNRRPIPKGASVTHTCGNPWCVNPEHLQLW